MKPQRIQLSRKRGFNLQKFSRKLNGLPAVNCARPSRWGNPFCVALSNGIDAETAVHLFERANNPPHARIREDLRGKNLACWCAVGQPCHCDVLLELANS